MSRYNKKGGTIVKEMGTNSYVNVKRAETQGPNIERLWNNDES